MGWKEWSAWLKGGMIGIILSIIFFLLYVFLFANPTKGFQLEYFYALLILLLIFIIPGVLIGLVINRNWSIWLKCGVIGLIIIILLFILTYLLAF